MARGRQRDRLDLVIRPGYINDLVFVCRVMLAHMHTLQTKRNHLVGRAQPELIQEYDNEIQRVNLARKRMWKRYRRAQKRYQTALALTIQKERSKDGRKE